jgi:hypothetical protein
MAELDFTNIADGAIATPAAGVTALSVDSVTKRLRSKDDAGKVLTIPQLFNFSVASQAPAATTRTYITGSQLAIPVGKLQVGTILRWKFNITKTAAGVAASTIDIAFGTAGTTADTARVSFAKPAGTAVADEGWCEVSCVVRGPLSAVGVVVGEFRLVHNLAATGHAVIPCVVVNTISGTFDVTTPTFVGLCITTGSADVITIQQVEAEATGL